MSAPQQAPDSFVVFFAMLLPREHRWIAMWLHSFIENNAVYVFLFFAFWAFCRFMNNKFDAAVESALPQHNQDTRTGAPAHIDTQDDCHSGTTDQIEAPFENTIYDTPQPIPQIADESIQQAIIDELYNYNEEIVKPLQTELFTAKADLITVKDELAAVRNQTSSLKEDVVTKHMVVTPIQDQLDRIEKQVCEKLLGDLRSEARKCALQANRDFGARLDDTDKRMLEQVDTVMDLTKDLSKLPGKVDQLQANFQQQVEQLEVSVEQQQSNFQQQVEQLEVSVEQQQSNFQQQVERLGSTVEQQGASVTALVTAPAMPSSSSVDADIVSKMQEDIKAQSSSITKFSAPFDDMKGKVNRLKAYSEQRISQLEAIVSSQATTIIDLKNAKHELTTENARMLERFAKLEAIVDRQQKQLQTLSALPANVNALEAKLKAISDPNGQENVSTSTSPATTETLKQHAAQLTMHTNQFEEMHGVKKDIDTLKLGWSEHANKFEAIEDNHKNISDLQGQLEDIKMSLNEQESIPKQIDALHERVRTLEHADTMTDADRKQIGTIPDLRAKVAQVDWLVKTTRQSAEAIGAIQTTATESLEAISDLQGEAKGSAEAIMALQSAAKESEEGISSLEDATDRLREGIHNVEAELEDFKDSIEKMMDAQGRNCTREADRVSGRVEMCVQDIGMLWDAKVDVPTEEYNSIMADKRAAAAPGDVQSPASPPPPSDEMDMGDGDDSSVERFLEGEWEASAKEHGMDLTDSAPAAEAAAAPTNSTGALQAPSSTFDFAMPAGVKLFEAPQVFDASRYLNTTFSLAPLSPGDPDAPACTLRPSRASSRVIPRDPPASGSDAGRASEPGSDVDAEGEVCDPETGTADVEPADSMS